MKALPVGLQAHLDSGTTTLCWCWKVSRTDGVVLGFTDHDLPLSFAGVDFEPESGFTASEIRAGSDLSVDSQDAEGALSSDRISETDILDGRYDAAEVEVWRVNWRAVAHRALMRRGAIGEVRRGKSVFVAEMRSLAHVLDQSIGRTFQYTCDRALGDGKCKVNLGFSAYSGGGAVTSLLRSRAFLASGLASFTDGWFTNGILTWSTGPNAGRQAEVSAHSNADGFVTLTLLVEPVRAIAASHSFTIVAGCDKSADACRLKFGNIANFRGFPHIPGQDTVLRYARQSGRNSGDPL